MGALKSAGSLLARFLMCLALIACFWVVSISYRIGPFHADGRVIPGRPAIMADSDWLFLAAALALVVGLTGLYRSGRIQAVLMVLASLLVLTAVDHVWGVYGYVDDYKGVPAYALQATLAAVLLSPFPFLFPARREGHAKMLAACWAALILTILLIGTNSGHHLLGLNNMIGPTYMQVVFLCLLVPELLRQALRLGRALSLAD